MIVCWEHNWPDVPRGIEVVELRREYGLGFNVWIMPVGDEYKEFLDENDREENWSLPSQCHKDDLVLFYFTKPDCCIKHIFIAKTRSMKVKEGYQAGKSDTMAPIRRVCELKSPIFLEDLRRDRVLKTSGFVRGSMQGRPCATEFWPYLHEMIVRRNPSVRNKLKKFAPENL